MAQTKPGVPVAGYISSLVGYEGTVRWDASQPDGAGDASSFDPDADAFAVADVPRSEASQDTRGDDVRREDRPDDGNGARDGGADRVEDGPASDAPLPPSGDGAPSTGSFLTRLDGNLNNPAHIDWTIIPGTGSGDLVGFK